MFTAYATLPTLEPAPRDVLLASIGAPAALALVLLVFVVVCARLAQRKLRRGRRLQLVRSMPRATVRRAA